jgi:hypothetical protein
LGSETRAEGSTEDASGSMARANYGSKIWDPITTPKNEVKVVQ